MENRDIRTEMKYEIAKFIIFIVAVVFIYNKILKILISHNVVDYYDNGKILSWLIMSAVLGWYTMKKNGYSVRTPIFFGLNGDGIVLAVALMLFVFGFRFLLYSIIGIPVFIYKTGKKIWNMYKLFKSTGAENMMELYSEEIKALKPGKNIEE